MVEDAAKPVSSNIAIVRDVRAGRRTTIEVMDVHFTPELQAKLNQAAADIQTGPDEYVQQLVEHYLDHDVWFRQKVNVSLSQLDRGEFLSHEEAGERLRKLLRS